MTFWRFGNANSSLLRYSNSLSVQRNDHTRSQRDDLGVRRSLPPPDLLKLDLLAELPRWVARIVALETEVTSLKDEVLKLRQGDPEELLDTERAAAFLGISPGALRKAEGRGSIPGQRVGRRLRFRRGDLIRARR